MGFFCKSWMIMKRITVEQYRNVDLMMWIVMTIVFETITTMATIKWFYLQPVALSITLALVCAVMMRWNGYAAIIAGVGGLVVCIISGANIEQYVIYCIGNMFALIAMLLMKYLGKEKIQRSFLNKVLFATVAYVGMVLGRWVVSLFFGGDVTAFTVYITTDIMSLLFAVMILHILGKCDGMIEDQKAYLQRVWEEDEEENNIY